MQALIEKVRIEHPDTDFGSLEVLVKDWQVGLEKISKTLGLRFEVDVYSFQFFEDPELVGASNKASVGDVSGVKDGKLLVRLALEDVGRVSKHGYDASKSVKPCRHFMFLQTYNVLGRFSMIDVFTIPLNRDLRKHLEVLNPELNPELEIGKTRLGLANGFKQEFLKTVYRLESFEDLKRFTGKYAIHGKGVFCFKNLRYNKKLDIKTSEKLSIYSLKTVLNFLLENSKLNLGLNSKLYTKNGKVKESKGLHYIKKCLELCCCNSEEGFKARFFEFYFLKPYNKLKVLNRKLAPYLRMINT
ncbi:hypothetical protein J7L02_03225 [Candidatus Woesearchaeota archaeon]|nr:hypothetical protein [Candidatus Woesearchaeota archaeon]